MVFITLGYSRGYDMSRCCLETKCLQCCIETNMVLTNQDVARIKQLGYAVGFFVKKHKGWLQLRNIQGRCVFHNGIQCTIYPHRPKGCMLYPIVYDKDNRCAIFDSECPQKHCFTLSPSKVRQLSALVSLLEKERTIRTNETP